MPLIPLCVKATAERDPNRPFCTFLSRGTTTRISYGMLYEQSQRYARAYMRSGVRPQDIVVISLQHSPQLYYSFLGATLAGAIPSFMPFPSPKQRPELYWADLHALFVRLKPALVVSYPANIAAARELLADAAPPFLAAGDDLFVSDTNQPVLAYPGLNVDPDSTFCLQHSSGTTGLKKGVMLTHRTVLGHIEAYCDAIAFTPRDRIVSWLPLYHDMGFIACFILSLVRGTHLIALDPFEWAARPRLLLEAIAAHRPTLCWLPNFAFEHLVRSTRDGETFDLHSMRAFINCSEPCKPSTFVRFIERFAPSGVDETKLGVCYAMAENVFAVTQTRLGEPVPSLAVSAEALSHDEVTVPRAGESEHRLSGCGTRVDGVAVRVRNAAGADCPPGHVGEVHVSGASLFSGYYEQPELTGTRLRDGWYATGDLGFLADDQLYITGRTDDMLIVNGRNYYAHDIELLLASVPGIVPGRVAVIDASTLHSDATGIAVLAELGAGADGGGVARDVRTAVLEASGLAVQRVVMLGAGQLIKTTSGKIDRKKNRQLYLESQAAPLLVNG